MPNRKWIEQFRNGDDVDEVFLLVRKDLRQTRTGSLYIDGEVSDRTGALPLRMWDATEAVYQSFEADDFVRVRGRIEKYKDRLQVIATQIKKADESKVNMEDFQPASRYDPDEMEQQLRKILRGVKNPHLLELLAAFFNDAEFMAAFKQCPAATSFHHAFLGGLLEHTLSLAKVASRIAADYPMLDKDLLLTGVFLHDIGKTRELSWSRGFQYTDEGGLVGHLIIGVSMLEEKARALDNFPPDLLNTLKHLILSHHGEYEFGSPKLPLTAEAVALHHLDNLDAKVFAFDKAIREAPDAASNWTDYNRVFERRLFKGSRPE